MILKRLKFVAAALMMAVLPLVAVATPVSADQEKIHILISPTRTRVSLEPGDHYRGSFEVHNIGTEQFTYRVYATPYQVTGEDYQQDFSTPTKFTYISEWISFDKDSDTLQPGSYHTVNYTISVPLDAPAGGQYAALMAETDNNEDFAVQTISRVGMLLYGRVSGDTVEAGEIIENKIPSFFFKKPVTASSLIDNTKSNVHGIATYNLRVYHIFTGEEIYSNEQDDPEIREKTIFPDTRRFNTVSWDEAPALGIFRVEQEIEFMGQTSTLRKVVIICPLWLIILILIIIIAIIIHLVMKSKERKELKKEKADN